MPVLVSVLTVLLGNLPQVETIVAGLGTLAGINSTQFSAVLTALIAGLPNDVAVGQILAKLAGGTQLTAEEWGTLGQSMQAAHARVQAA